MKEKIKTLILVLLVISSITLASVTWIDGRLWPEGYSLFVNVRNWPLVKFFYEEDYSVPLENLGRARKIVIASGSGSSAVYYNTDKIYESVYDDIRGLIVSFLKGETKVSESFEITKENVREMLNEQIMYAYVNYPVATMPALYTRLMGVAESRALEGVSAVRDFFIIPAGDEMVELLVIDNEDESVICFELTYEKTEAMILAFSDYVSETDPSHNCMLALEMNLDKETPDSLVKQTVLLDSFLVLDSASTANLEKKDIIGKNPLDTNKEEIIEKIVPAFGYNPGTFNRYTDSNGTVIYLGNDSTLKIYKNGIVEYEALSKERGISLGRSASLYESLNGAIRFAGTIFSSAVEDGEFNVNVSGDLLYESSGSINFAFDYYCRGTPVVANVREEEISMDHGVEITARDGYITSFKMLLREYEETARKRDTLTVYGAIDKIASMYSESEEVFNIDDIFLAYKEDGKSNTIKTCWTGYAGGRRIIVEN